MGRFKNAILRTIQSAIAVIDGFHDVPSQNSSDNSQVRDAVGNKTDYIGVPYSFGISSIIAHLNTSYYHIHGTAFTLPKYEDPVTLTSEASAWGTAGAIAEVILASTVTKAFDLHWIQVSDISANFYGIIDIYSGDVGSEVLISSCPIFRTSNFISEGSIRIQIPQQEANKRISCKLSDSISSSQTCKVKFMGHEYG